MPRKTTVAAFTAGSTLRTSCFLPLPSNACLGVGLGLGFGLGSGLVLATAVEGLLIDRKMDITRYTTRTPHPSAMLGPSIYLSLYLSVYLSKYLSLSIHLSIYLSCL